MSILTSTQRYLRLDQQSIQGKFTSMLLSIAAVVGILFLINFWYVAQQQERQQELLQVWHPSATALEKIAIHLQAGSSRQEHFSSQLGLLNSLADRWQNDRMLIYHEQLLEQVENYLQKAEAGEQETNIRLPEWAGTQKLLTRMQAETGEQIRAHEQANLRFLSHLKLLFGLEYALFFLMGMAIGVYIITSIFKKIRLVRNYISDLSKGYLADGLEVRNDEFYNISRSILQLSDNLKEVTHFAGEVGRGNLDASLNAFDEKGELGRSLSEMRDSLRQVADKEKNVRWFNEGIATFAEILRRHSGHVDELCGATVSELVKYTGALQGAVFVTKTSQGTTVLQMSACYAYDRQKYLHKEIPVDSGLIGQAFLEKAPKYLREIPKNWESITTGLGQGSPESILMIPLMHGGQAEGVLELASLRSFQEHELEFLNKVTESLAASISAVRTSQETRRLLQESQGVAEELRSQEEEMRQNMEEMQATQEEMARAQRELANKETNLNAFINNTTDSIITVTRDYKVGLINDVLKARYKGSQYEGIDTGTDIMPTLGDVADVWKAYYDRAFAGERLNFTLKSSVRGEDSWREYTIHPITDKEGNNVGCSVISRDITDKVKQEASMAQKSAVLAKVVELKADGYLALDTAYKVIVTTKGVDELLPELETQPREHDLLLNLMSADSRSRWKEVYDIVLSGKPVNLNTKTAQEEDVKLMLQPIHNDQKEIIALLIAAKKG
ncbi:GAF domain-containing protein [Cesiribacter andamanensis]|uniref:Putative periplasmic ligand-binding sensor domain protein n=1 Tax=Cesiribacter andamanensis AMV16 TaxID=1279009 RepID=M7N9I1_9BACT|nr:GAF domain-containing protein [Cesiribacter andamanensis]EMR03922.1 putative periplasmic ligand-binding sensor domain protein [Cesiribacter andamanensis AMV16]